MTEAPSGSKVMINTACNSCNSCCGDISAVSTTAKLAQLAAAIKMRCCCDRESVWIKSYDVYIITPAVTAVSAVVEKL